MILESINQASKYLPSLNLDLANDRLEDFFRRAQDWLVSHIIGEEIEEVLEMEVSTNSTDDHAELRQHCQRVIAEKGLLDAIPEMDMQLTEAGFAVQDNDNFSPASAQRVDRLIAKMPERIAADVDALVRFLMKNSVSSASDGESEETSSAPYDYWRDSVQFNYLTAAFMPLFVDYTAHCNGLNPKAGVSTAYDDFYAIIPLMAMEMRNTANYYVSKEEVDRLVGLYRSDQLLDVHRRAIVALKDVAVFALRYNTTGARNSAVQARDIMLANLEYFPAFAASPAARQKDINLDGGKTVNFL